MKTNTIKRFEKDLKDNGYEYELVKELRDITRYTIFKDGYTFNYETYNVLDKPKNGFVMFEKSFNLFKQVEDLKLELEKKGREEN